MVLSSSSVAAQDAPIVESADAWRRVKEKLRFKHGEATYNSWLGMLELAAVDSHEVILHAPTRFVREWILSHYLDDIRQFWQEENTAIYNCVLLVRPSQAQDESEVQAMPYNAASQHNEAEAEAAESPTMVESRLDPRFVFDNFIIGPSNQLAHAAARNIAEATTVVPGTNPLFFYGGVGLGKTHLMQAIAWHIRQTNPGRKVAYLSAEKFMYQFIRALRNKDVVSFKEAFRSVDVLMIDDIQFICGKNSTQEEFFHTFNALIDEGKQLILSGDRSPSDLDGMEERIRSRMGWGLVVDINSTTYELRLGILQSKVEQLNVNIPPEVLDFLATKITSNIRELEGALNKVVASAGVMKQPVTMETTQFILRDLLRANQRTITIDDIQKRVAEHCNVKVADMHSARRARAVARPRQIAMYLSKKLTTHSLPEIGRKFGGKDHTTVMHAVKRVEALCIEDKALKEDVTMLMRMLQS